jgi:hypothetical protein
MASKANFCVGSKLFCQTESSVFVSEEPRLIQQT